MSPRNTRRIFTSPESIFGPKGPMWAALPNARNASTAWADVNSTVSFPNPNVSSLLVESASMQSIRLPEAPIRQYDSSILSSANADDCAYSERSIWLFF
jgi:hypothetical protein